MPAMNPLSSLKGNLGLRSSPLSPSSSKLSTQYLVLDHMANHYRKLTTAKSRIDCQPPKSIKASQKSRDNQRRKKIAQTGRSQSATGFYRRPVVDTQYLSDEYDIDEDETFPVDGRTTADEMRLTLRSPLDRQSRNKTVHGNLSQTLRLDCIRAKKSEDDGDIIKKRQHAFTEPARPFTPRTLKSNRTSRLSEYRYYSKPQLNKDGSKTTEQF